MTKLNQLTLIVLLLLTIPTTYLMLKTHDLQEQLDAAQPVSTWSNAVTALTAPPAPPLTHSRPWVKLNSSTPADNNSYFDFSDSEWSALTNAFATKLENPSTLRFDEGAVHRVSTSRLKALSNESTLRTNSVWFFAPSAATNAVPEAVNEPTPTP